MSPPHDDSTSADGGSLAVEPTSPASLAASLELPAGTRINQYEIIRILGRGGMGTVFLARDLRLGRRVAIKFLQADQPGQARRLLAEARTTARCQHDNIVVIHEAGEHDGMLYLVLEYLDGQPLSSLLDKGPPLPYTRAVEIMCSIVRALSCAHEAGIVHRDLKPDNIFVTATGTVKVLDFGIAKVLQPPQPQLQLQPPGPLDSSDELAVRQESDRMVAGTLQYMSPEQWGPGGEIDHLTDIWACGILLHQMICGRHPLPPNRLITTATLEQPMPSMDLAAPPDVPRELVQVVDRCLLKPKAQRWQSAAELLDALAPFLPGRRTIELKVDESPYAGLASFQELDAGKFFGRTHEIAEMVARIRDRPLMAVVGSSGVGKSSFVRAGVIPALKRSGEPWETPVIRPGRKPIEALAWMIQPMIADGAGTAANTSASPVLRGGSSGPPSLADEVAEQRKLVETLYREPGHLGDVLRLRTRRGQRRLLLFVDQFEELYTLVSDPAEREAFTACLSAVADDATSPLRVVLSIRSDFFDRAAEDRRFVGELTSGLFLLGRPSRDGLREAIVSPAELAGYRFETPAIIDDMLAHLAAAPGALPLLQFAAAKLWDTRDQARRMLTHESYTRMGGVAGALASHADLVVSNLGSQKLPLIRTILLRLVTAERTRAIVPLAELRELSPEEGEVQGLIDCLVDARLLVVQTLEGSKVSTVEIVHESLIHGWPTLRRWLEENQEDAALVEQLRIAARQWDAKRRDRGLLWRGDALAEYRRWRTRHPAGLTPLEAAFGAASVEEAARGRRIRRSIAVSAIAVIAVFFFALWRANLAANHARREAEGLARDAYFEQGRLNVLAGDKLGAIAPLADAYRMGGTGAPTRFLLEEAARTTRARVLTLRGHTDKVMDVAYSPDGKWLATASLDHTARVWDAETGALYATVRHASPVTAIAFSPDSRLVASGGQDLTVRVSSASDGSEIETLPVRAATRRVAFSPDASMVLTASVQRANLWRMPGGTPLRALEGHERILDGTFCESGACIMTWDEARIVVWQTATFMQRASAPLPEGARAAAVSRTGALLAVGTRSGELVLLRGDGSPIAKHAAHDAEIVDIAISPDESLVATASNDRTARLWSASGEPRGILAGHRANLTRVRFTPAGDRLVTTSADSTVRLWSASGMPLGELAGHANLIAAAAIRSDGGRLATASWDHTVIVWDLVRAPELRPILGARDGALPRVAFDPGGLRLAVARADGSLSVVDVQTEAIACTARSGAAVQRLAWATSEQLAVVRPDGKDLELWSARRCAVESKLAHQAPIDAMSTQVGPRLVTAAGGIVHVWRGGHVEVTFTGYPGRIEAVGIDGGDVYAITTQPALVVVDAIEGPAPRRIFRAGDRDITDLHFDRARGQIVAASADQYLYIWDAATGMPDRKLEGSGPLMAARTSADGALAIGVGGHSPVVWDRASGEKIAQLEGHSAPVQDGEFIDDRLFISRAADHTALVWDVAAARPLTAFHDVAAMVFAADRRTVAFVGATGVRVWSPRAPEPDLEALRALRAR